MRRTGGVDGVKNQSGQWEGSSEGELDGCIVHRVHTSVGIFPNYKCTYTIQCIILSKKFHVLIYIKPFSQLF
jgi:hypothetical protein